MKGGPDIVTAGAQRRLLRRISGSEARFLADVFRRETVGGALLLAAAVAALVWANSPWAERYFALRDFAVGPESLHLHLTLGTWAADGLLAVFFFVVGLELKREFVAGDLRDPAIAALPVAASVAGVAVPALLYMAVNALGGGALSGWAVPTATDIAFALAVLAVIASHLPGALRTFLLTLAVVDDLIAILIIAIVFTDHLDVIPLLLAAVPLGLFAAAVRRGLRTVWLLLPLGVVCWGLVHASGVHATVAGVLLAFAIPVARGAGGDLCVAEQFEHRWRPLSASVAVPVFAFFAAGVNVGGLDGLGAALRDPVAIGVVIGLVVGKPLGIAAAAFLVARFTRASLDPDLAWWDVIGIGMLAGVGFTVSLLIGELAFGAGTGRDDRVKVAVLAGSLLAAVLATIVLRAREKVYRRLAEAEEALLSEPSPPGPSPGPRSA